MYNSDPQSTNFISQILSSSLPTQNKTNIYTKMYILFLHRLLIT